MPIDIQTVSISQRHQLRDMLDTYLKELSQYGAADLTYRYFDSYWQDNNRWPYFILKDNQIVGFALVNTHSLSGQKTDFFMAEFYVSTKCRGNGIGQKALRKILDLHPGQWELGILPNNTSAKAFWTKSLTALRGTEMKTLPDKNVLTLRFNTSHY